MRPLLRATASVAVLLAAAACSSSTLPSNSGTTGRLSFQLSTTPRSVGASVVHADITVLQGSDGLIVTDVPLLARKTHLLIEKPICASLAEAERVLAAAREQGCLVQVGHIEHFNPVMSFLEKEIDEPRYITAERLAPYQPRGTEVG